MNFTRREPANQLSPANSRSARRGVKRQHIDFAFTRRTETADRGVAACSHDEQFVTERCDQQLLCFSSHLF
jgi:hypothetical protein